MPSVVVPLEDDNFGASNLHRELLEHVDVPAGVLVVRCTQEQVLGLRQTMPFHVTKGTSNPTQLSVGLGLKGLGVVSPQKLTLPLGLHLLLEIVLAASDAQRLRRDLGAHCGVLLAFMTPLRAIAAVARRAVIARC